MYLKHFGLRKRPFIAQVTGTDVFVGPQIAKSMSGLKNALESKDAVVTVSGPAGSGKTTLVARALDSLTSTHRSIRVGRMQLEGTDILEFLLEELGTAELPKGPIRQFAALREKLGQLESTNVQVVVVVEDAVRTGAETLAELEALTAADAGNSTGAAIVLMGDDRLAELLTDSELARLDQRIRQRHGISPLSATELRAYLIHCFRLAGADFEQIFDPRSSVLIHALSGGIPRVANNIVEATMKSAAADGLKGITSTFVGTVAKEEFGLVADDSDAVPPAVEITTEPEPMARPEPAPESNAATVADPVIVSSDKSDEEELLADNEIQELLQDTLPELEVLEPEVVAAQEAESPPEPEPAWERDPTLAQLKPDLDALEKAMAVAQGEPASQPDAKDEDTAELPSAEDIPEITLDDAIQTGVENNLIDEPGQISPIASETPTVPTTENDTEKDETEKQDTAEDNVEMEEIAAKLSKARTIEDVDEKLAETLFGEEFSAIAAQVVAKVNAEKSANDETAKLLDTSAAQMAQASGSTPTEAAPIEVSLETPKQGGESGLDLSASQRLKTVQALNADLHPSLRNPKGTPDAVAKPKEPPQATQTPEPIEDQINTSMTQTLEALNVRPPTSDSSNPEQPEFDDEPEEKKGGFLSRFKRS